MTDRLWEVGDIVDMMDAWEAKRRRDARPIFEAVKQMVGGGWFVRAMLPNALPEQIFGGFETEDDALRWIKNESQAWLHQRRMRLAS